MRIAIIAGEAMREAARRKLVLAAAVVGAVYLLLCGLSFDSVAHHAVGMDRLQQRQASGIFLLLGLYAVDLLVALLAILCSMDALSGEISSGAMQTLLSKPLPRWQLWIGKWLGLMAMLTVLLAALAGGVMAIAYIRVGYATPHPALGLGLMWMEMVLLLTLTLLWGTRLPTLASGALSLGLYGMAFLGGWIEQIGALSHYPRAVHIGIAASLLMPSEALWRRAAFEMQPALAGVLSLGPFADISVPSWQMVGFAAVYMLAAVALALYWFERRDL